MQYNTLKATESDFGNFTEENLDQIKYLRN